MRFTYEAYKELLEMIKNKGYVFTDYDNYKKVDKPCILRHDIDYSLEKAIMLAKLENNMNVHSTFFILVSSGFYNVFSKEIKEQIEELLILGHKLGLHFDETVYEQSEIDFEKYMIDRILYEKNLLESATGVDISAVSMHRPSKRFLETDLKIPGMLNSYSKEFFDDFKYVSDSRHRWREDIEEIVKHSSYKRLHVLTHAFWYNNKELSLKESLCQYLDNSKYSTWNYLDDNFSDLDTVVKKEDI